MWKTGMIILYLLGIVELQTLITPLDNHAVFLERIGQATLFKSEWKVITQLKLIDEEEAFSFIQTCETHVEKLCNLLETNKAYTLCKAWKNELTTLTNNIKRKLLDLHLSVMPRKRTKRGLLNAGGKLAKFLLGTVDSDDSEKIYAKLQVLEKHDQENIHLMQNQVSIVKSSIDTVSAALINISLNEEKLGNRYQELEKRVAQEILAVNVIHLKTDVNEIIPFIILTLQQIYNHINDQFIVINAISIGKLHPLLISPKTLLELTHQISQHYHVHPFLKEIAFISQISQIQSLINDSTMYIRINIPLLEAFEYSINKIYPLPVHLPSNFTVILDLDSDYLLNNTEHQTYIEFTHQEYPKSCHKINYYRDIYVCHQIHAKTIGLNPESCLISILNNKTIKFSICKQRIVSPETEIISKLTTTNTWLFKFDQEKQLQIHCDNRVQIINLNKIGLLTLTKPCTFTIGFHELTYENNPKNEIPIHTPYTYIPPKVQFNNSPLPQRTINLSKQIRITGGKQYSEILRAHSKNIDEFSKTLVQTELNRNLELNRSHNTINSVVLTALVVILLILGAKIFISRRKHATQTPNLQVSIEPLTPLDSNKPTTITIPSNKEQKTPELSEKSTERSQKTRSFRFKI